MVKNKTVCVFDLDDTLYPEADYIESGIKAVCSAVEELHCINVFESIFELWKQGEADWLSSVCEMAGLPIACKPSLLWIYRLHSPDIQLNQQVRATLAELGKTCHLAILTDGRSMTQRLKLKALGLSDIPVYISEEFSSEKPGLKRFEQITYDFEAVNYFYIGDNPLKDFFAPNQLGWETIGIRCFSWRKCVEARLSSVYLPRIWVNQFDEIPQFIC
jgi:putative hydrolase of the HAD superfamily